MYQILLKKKIDLANLKLKNVPNNLNNFKNKVDKLDVDKLVLVSVDFSNLSNVVKKMMLLKKMYSKIKNIEDKIPVITNVATNTTVNAKINEVKGEMYNITNLVTTTTAYTAGENKIPNACNLATKKIITTQKLVRLKIKLLLIMIMINTLLLKNLIS